MITMGIKLLSRNLDFRSMAKDLGQRVVLTSWSSSLRKKHICPNKSIVPMPQPSEEQACFSPYRIWALKGLHVNVRMCNLIPNQSGDFETTQVSDMKASDSTWNQGREMGTLQITQSCCQGNRSHHIYFLKCSFPANLS